MNCLGIRNLNNRLKNNSILMIKSLTKNKLKKIRNENLTYHPKNLRQVRISKIFLKVMNRKEKSALAILNRIMKQFSPKIEIKFWCNE